MILQEGKKKNSYIIPSASNGEKIGSTWHDEGNSGGSFKPEAKWNDDCACARNAFCIRQGDNWEN